MIGIYRGEGTKMEASRAVLDIGKKKEKESYDIDFIAIIAIPDWVGIYAMDYLLTETSES